MKSLLDNSKSSRVSNELLPEIKSIGDNWNSFERLLLRSVEGELSGVMKSLGDHSFERLLGVAANRVGDDSTFDEYVGSF